MTNYAETLESYLIPAEESVIGSPDRLSKFILGAFTAAGVALITTASIIKIVNSYKTNRIYAPFAPAKAISIIINGSKYESIKINSNIYELLKNAESVVHGSSKYFDALNKAMVDKSEKDAIIAIDNLTKYFRNAMDTKIAKVADGESITLYRGSSEISSLRSALSKYTEACDRIFTKRSAIYDAFTSQQIVIDTEKVTTIDSEGNRNVTYNHVPKIETLPPTKVTISALTEYQETLNRFHEKVIDIKIKRK